MTLQAKFAILIIQFLFFSNAFGADSRLHFTGAEQRALVQNGNVLLNVEIKLLKSGGINVGEKGLKYLALELFHNTPFRDCVHDFSSNINVYDFVLNRSGRQSELFRTFFPWISSQRKSKSLILKAIKISGKGNSFFVFDPKSGAFFVGKLTEMPGLQNSMTIALTREIKKREIDFDFAPELEISDSTYHSNAILRPIASQRRGSPLQENSNLETEILPMHGVMGSVVIHDLALKKGMTTFEYLQAFYLPELVRFSLKSVFELGIMFPHHLQNLWVSINKNGDIRLIGKDLEDVLHIPFAGEIADSSYHKTAGRWNFGYTAFNRGSAYNPRTREPGYHFASLGLQALVDLFEFTPNEKAIMVQRYFTLLIGELQKKHSLNIILPEKLKRELARLTHYTHDYDIRIEREKTRLIGPQEPDVLSGLDSLVAALMGEIINQASKSRIGSLRSPNTPAEMGILEGLRHTAIGMTPVGVLASHPKVYQNPVKDGNRFSKVRGWLYEKKENLQLKLMDAKETRLVMTLPLMFNSQNLVGVDPKTQVPLVVYALPPTCKNLLAELFEVKHRRD